MLAKIRCIDTGFKEVEKCGVVFSILGNFFETLISGFAI